MRLFKKIGSFLTTSKANRKKAALEAIADQIQALNKYCLDRSRDAKRSKISLMQEDFKRVKAKYEVILKEIKKLGLTLERIKAMPETERMRFKFGNTTFGQISRINYFIEGKNLAEAPIGELLKLDRE